MIAVHLIITLSIFLFIMLPCAIISVPVVAIKLLTSWSGYTTIFGNSKWGKGNTHYAFPTKGYWQEFLWLVWRNPVNNLCSNTLSLKSHDHIIVGDRGIGDKTHGGFYRISMGNFWEYYWIKPYGKRCVRLRFGWKILDKVEGQLCEYVLSFNPIKPYKGN